MVETHKTPSCQPYNQGDSLLEEFKKPSEKIRKMSVIHVHFNLMRSREVRN